MSEYSTDKSIQAELQELSEKYGVKLEVVLSTFKEILNEPEFKEYLNIPEIKKIDNLAELTPWLAANLVEDFLVEYQRGYQLGKKAFADNPGKTIIFVG